MSTLTQEQRDRKNAKLREARAAQKDGVVRALPVKVSKSGKPSPAKTANPVFKSATNKRKLAATVARKKGSGGARATSNKPSTDGGVMVVISFRGSAAQKKKFDDLGGGTWGRARIDAATVKPGK